MCWWCNKNICNDNKCATMMKHYRVLVAHTLHNLQLRELHKVMPSNWRTYSIDVHGSKFVALALISAITGCSSWREDKVRHGWANWLNCVCCGVVDWIAMDTGGDSHVESATAQQAEEGAGGNNLLHLPSNSFWQDGPLSALSRSFSRLDISLY